MTCWVQQYIPIGNSTIAVTSEMPMATWSSSYLACMLQLSKRQAKAGRTKQQIRW